MTDVRFYHLQQKKPAQALPEILSKALERKLRVIVKAASEEQLEAINAGLWAHDAAGFLPHGSAREGHAAEQPIWLTLGNDNPNGATMLVLVDGADAPPLDAFTMACEVFDGNDDAVVEAARARWKSYKDKNYVLSYFQQDFDGKWQKK